MRNANHRTGLWITLFLLMTFNAVSVVDRNIISLVLIDIGRDLDLNDLELSFIHGGAFAFFYGTGGLLLGYAIDKYPRKYIIYFSVTIWSLAAAACGLARTFTELILSRVLVGAGEGGVGPASQSLISSLFDKDKLAFPMSLFVASSSVGMGLSFIAGGVLLDILEEHSAPGLSGLAPWRQLLLVTSIPGLAIAFLAFALVEPDRSKKIDRDSVATWRDFLNFVWANRKLVFGLLGGYGLCSAVTYGALSWAPTYARRVLDMTPSETGWTLGLIAMVGGPLSMAAYGVMMDRRAARGDVEFPLRAFAWGMAFAVPVGMVGFTLDHQWAFLSAILVTQCVLVSSYGPAAAVIQLITPPTMRGRMAALMVAMFSLSAYAAGPILVGAITDYVLRDPDRVGYSIALLFICIGPLAAGCIWLSRARYVAYIR